MDTSTAGVATLVLALLAIVLGLLGAVLGGRARGAQRALAGQVAALRQQIESLEDATARQKDRIDTLAGEAGPAQETAALQLVRLEAMTGALEGMGQDVEAAAVRADGLDARIRILEGRLRDHASEPPPIPSGKRPGRLEDLRAVLRAQAVEEVEQAEQAARAKLLRPPAAGGGGKAPEASEAS